jgi:hypothetical protein
MPLFSSTPYKAQIKTTWIIQEYVICFCNDWSSAYFRLLLQKWIFVLAGKFGSSLNVTSKFKLKNCALILEDGLSDFLNMILGLSHSFTIWENSSLCYLVFTGCSVPVRAVKYTLL